MNDLVQRRRALTEGMMHSAIYEAAAAVLAEVGFTALTMERVAEAAGVSKGTLYNYFQDKEALVLEVIDRSFAPLSEAVDRVFEEVGDPQRKLTEVVRLILTGIDERRALGQAICPGSLSPRLDADLRGRQMRIRRRFVEGFRQAAAAGHLRAGCSDPEALGRLLAVILGGVIDERMLHGSECPAVEQEVSLIEGHVLRLWFKETC